MRLELAEIPGVKKDENQMKCNDEHWRQFGEKRRILGPRTRRDPIHQAKGIADRKHMQRDQNNAQTPRHHPINTSRNHATKIVVGCFLLQGLVVPFVVGVIARKKWQRALYQTAVKLVPDDRMD
jgi:hypothetical protein